MSGGVKDHADSLPSSPGSSEVDSIKASPRLDSDVEVQSFNLYEGGLSAGRRFVGFFLGEGGEEERKVQVFVLLSTTGREN